MFSYLLCLKTKTRIRAPKFICFKIIRYIPYEEFKYGSELVKDYTTKSIIKGAVKTGNYSLLPQFRHMNATLTRDYYVSLTLKCLIKENKVDIIEKLPRFDGINEFGFYNAVKNCNYELTKYFGDKVDHLIPLPFEVKKSSAKIVEYLIKKNYNVSDLALLILATFDLEYIKTLVDFPQDGIPIIIDLRHSVRAVLKVIKNNEEISDFIVSKMFDELEGAYVMNLGTGKSIMKYCSLKTIIKYVDNLILKHNSHILISRFPYESIKDLINIKDISVSDFSFACKYNNISCVNWILENGTYNLKEGIEAACVGGHLEMVKYLEKFGDVDWDSCLISSVESQNLQIFEYCLSKGAANMELVLSRLLPKKGRNLIKFLLAKKTKYDRFSEIVNKN